MVPILYSKIYDLACSNFKISSIYSQFGSNVRPNNDTKNTLSILVIKLWRSIARPPDMEHKYFCIQNEAMNNSF